MQDKDLDEALLHQAGHAVLLAGHGFVVLGLAIWWSGRGFIRSFESRAATATLHLEAAIRGLADPLLVKSGGAFQRGSSSA